MQRGAQAEVFRYFLRLGCIAFGGPAAHIALMRRELVQQRGWTSDAEFVDMLGAANLIPGPNSTELSMHLGATRAGWRGLWVAGAGFIGPAVAIVLALAWAYVRWGTSDVGLALAWGIQPLILAVVLQALWGLRRTAVKDLATAVAAAAAAAAAFLGVDELAVIFACGFGMFLLRYRGGPGGLLRRAQGAADGVQGMFVTGLPAWAGLGGLGMQTAAAAPEAYSRFELFLVFLKVGALLYGSGYVLLSFMETDLVDARGWLTHQELLDAVAAGQFTPGPLFSSATFAGYVIDGLPGAGLATAGIFLPSFLFVAATHRLVPRLRRSAWAAPFLDGVNAASLALMAVVTLTLGREALDSPAAAALFLAGAAWLIARNPGTVWVVAAGAAAGLLRWALTG